MVKIVGIVHSHTDSLVASLGLLASPNWAPQNRLANAHH